MAGLEMGRAVVALALETTGPDSRLDHVIELGALARHGAGEETLSLLVALPPEGKVPYEVTLNTGLTRDILRKKGAPEKRAAEELAALLEKRAGLLLLWDAQETLTFLYKLMKRQGRETVLEGFSRLDLKTVCRDREKSLSSLARASGHYGLTPREATPLGRAGTLPELYDALRRERDDLARYEDLIGYDPKYGLAGPRIPGVTYRAWEKDSVGPLYDQIS